jgi:hypothetical protein
VTVHVLGTNLGCDPNAPKCVFGGKVGGDGVRRRYFDPEAVRAWWKGRL